MTYSKIKIVLQKPSNDEELINSYMDTLTNILLNKIPIYLIDTFIKELNTDYPKKICSMADSNLPKEVDK